MVYGKTMFLLVILMMIQGCAEDGSDQQEQGDAMKESVLELDGLAVESLGHAGFMLRGEKLVYIDPYESDADEKADIILITHGHYDHCSVADIQKLSTPDTVIIGTPSCQSKLPAERVSMKEFRIVKPGMKLEISGVTIETIPAYNINKQFHPKSDENIGYVVELAGKRVYHAGDTDKIPEMADLKDIDVAMLPVGGTYTMDAKEAAEACAIIKPRIAIPMHYGKIVGSIQDAETFKSLCKQEVRILN